MRESNKPFKTQKELNAFLNVKVSFVSKPFCFNETRENITCKAPAQTKRLPCKNNSTLANFNKAKSLFVVIFVCILAHFGAHVGAGRGSARCAACFARRHFLESNSNGIVCAVIKYFITYLAPRPRLCLTGPPSLPGDRILKS